MAEMIEGRKDALKLAYAWVIIMLAVNMFWVGYNITNYMNYSTLTEMSLYQMVMASQGTMNTSLESIDESNQGYSPSDINTNEGSTEALGFFDKFETLANIAKFVTFIIGFLTIGGMFTAWNMAKTISNSWVSLIVTMFFVIGQTIWLILLYKLIMNKGRPE